VEHSVFIFCGTIHTYILWNMFSDFCGMIQNLWPDFPKSQTSLSWSSKECSPIMRVKFTLLVQMVRLQCLSKPSDPKYVGGILYYGKWKENKDFFVTLFTPGEPALIDHLELPATLFDFHRSSTFTSLSLNTLTSSSKTSYQREPILLSCCTIMIELVMHR
jgi:hypothetical protein